MRTPAKLAAYGAVLAIVVSGGAGLGAAAGPIEVSGDDDHEVHTADDGPAGTGGDAEATALPAGLAVAQDGFRLQVDDTSLRAGAPSDFRFRVVDSGGAAVTRFAVEHEKLLHLVVVGRNLVDYAHLHPTLGADGTWSVELPALPAGSYRAFADFRPAGADALTLGVDLTVAGPTAPPDLPAPSRRATVDGYDVTLDGDSRPGESELAFAIARDGRSERTEPYLGAAGHLVAIRDGDLAYLHVHPLDSRGEEVRFVAEFPSPGTYRLFLDFAHGGRVHTAAFTVEIPADADSPSTSLPAAGDEHESH